MRSSATDVNRGPLSQHVSRAVAYLATPTEGRRLSAVQKRGLESPSKLQYDLCQIATVNGAGKIYLPLT
jgi:hypothetical protein